MSEWVESEWVSLCVCVAVHACIRKLKGEILFFFLHLQRICSIRWQNKCKHTQNARTSNINIRIHTLLRKIIVLFSLINRNIISIWCMCHTILKHEFMFCFTSRQPQLIISMDKICNCRWKNIFVRHSLLTLRCICYSFHYDLHSVIAVQLELGCVFPKASCGHSVARHAAHNRLEFLFYYIFYCCHRKINQTSVWPLLINILCTPFVKLGSRGASMLGTSKEFGWWQPLSKQPSFYWTYPKLIVYICVTDIF